MADVLPELPHMTHGELEQFLSSNAQDLKFTPQSVTTLRLRRRRNSVARKSDEQRWHHMEDSARKLNPGASSVLLSDASTPLIKVTVLGDDIQSKFESVKMMSSQEGPGAGAATSGGGGGKSAQEEQFDLRLIPVNPKTNTATANAGQSGAQAGPSLVQCWMPPTGQVDRHLRQELYDGTDCFVVMFSIRDRDSFDNVAQQWLREAENYIVSERENERMLCTIPIILIGAEAEARQAKVGLHQIAVSSPEAVQLAQDASVAKYMEVFSKNGAHMTEVLHQAVQAVTDARFQASLPHTLTQQRFVLASSVFMDLYSVPQSKGVFDLMNRTFRLTTSSGSTNDGASANNINNATTGSSTTEVGYWLTVDGTDPLTSTTAIRYSEAMQFDRPFPKLLRIAGKGRCQYHSVTTEFLVPRETPAPKGFFDTALKRFVVDTSTSTSTGSSSSRLDESLQLQDVVSGGVQLRYTLDGSDPTARSRIYSEPLDLVSPHAATSTSQVQSTPTPWGQDAADPPRMVKLVAIADGMFRSKVVTFDVPRLIDAPRVTYSSYDGTLKIEGSSYFDYRYTLDGSAPTPMSTLYSRPVMLPRDHHDNLRKIRVASFPKQYFPSREVIVEVGAQVRRDPEARMIAATKTSLSRTEGAQYRREAQGRDVSSFYGGKVGMAPGSRNASPMVQSFRSGSSPARGGRSGTVNSAGSSPARGAKGNRASPMKPVTIVQQGVTAAKALSPHRKKSHEGGIPPPPPSRPIAGGTPGGGSDISTLRREDSLTAGRGGLDAATVPPQSSAGHPQLAQDNAIHFEFEQPITLSHITVATPGSAQGPSSYQVQAKVLQIGPDGSQSAVQQLIGSGELEDTQGIQTLHVSATARASAIASVHCLFTPRVSGEPFQIDDMKIHGKPYRPQQ